MTQPRGRLVRDRDVLMVLAIVVIAVLAANLAAAFIPGLAAVIEGAPLVVVLLIVVTGVILLRALGGRRDSG